ncbi:hypothetical protein KIH39_10385 [Telmatocola sphagniphila]|uniref:Uncharacterized protein n=1 Tax=Telmatocola sphagniphila TaxID=1123043 RepID=A0A8E6BAA1_9BACT|nr:hypothetical protein [Telmatocola sphagniphila]QVL34289.1 hypothetical protein KIH39_10385 [Telmatocola sphagniphila]
MGQQASAAWMVKLQNRASEALQPSYRELQQALPGQAVVHGDESLTKEGSIKTLT